MVSNSCFQIYTDSCIGFIYLLNKETLYKINNNPIVGKYGNSEHVLEIKIRASHIIGHFAHLVQLLQ